MIPGDRRGTVLHRLPAGAKLLALTLFATATYYVTDLLWLFALFGVVAILFALARVPVRRSAAPLLALLWIFAVIAAAQIYLEGPYAAAVVVVRLATVVLAAHLVTETTAISAMIDAFVALLRPLKPLGVDPERVSLALAMVIRFVPLLAAIRRDVIDAQRARGHSRWSVTATTVPLIVRTLKMADEVAEAIEARGFESRGR